VFLGLRWHTLDILLLSPNKNNSKNNKKQTQNTRAFHQNSLVSISIKVPVCWRFSASPLTVLPLLLLPLLLLLLLQKCHAAPGGSAGRRQA